MKVRDLKRGDTVEVNRKGLTFTARFIRKLGGRQLQIEPITPGVNYIRIGSHMVRRRLAGVGGVVRDTSLPATGACCADGGLPAAPVSCSPDPGQAQEVLL